jgi:hypothetical protein
MVIQLIQGAFHPNDALDLITQMIQVKINYHEQKITGDCSEEDIKVRETKIKQLQKELYELKKELVSRERAITIDAKIALG